MTSTSSVGSVWSDPSEAPLSAATVEALQSQLEDFLTARGVVGVSAAIVSADGSWAGAAGVDGAGNAILPESAMAIASTTKSFVAAEILLLSQEGMIDLDAPVTDYVDLPFEANDATIRQLATMTSGFPELPEAAIRPAVSADLGKQWACSDVVGLVDPDATRLGTQGGAAAYNGLNYYVLGMVIEAVTGDSLAAAVRTDLLTPSGFDRIWTQTGSAPEKPEPPLALPVDDTTNPVVDPSSGFLPSAAAATSACGGAGMAADAPSLARWGYLLFGGHVIDPTLVGTMTTPNPQGGDFNYGFGAMIADDNGKPIWGHAGNYNQYTSIVLVWPETLTSVAVLVPVTGGPDNDSRGDLAFGLYQAMQTSQ
jgi:D-alanyl-D-alanine carboxypeptidase